MGGRLVLRGCGGRLNDNGGVVEIHTHAGQVRDTVRRLVQE